MSKWTDYVKKYATKHKLTYKEAVSQAGPSYKKLKAKEAKKAKKKKAKKKDEEDDEDKKPFCGIGKVPRSMRRGTPKECYDNNQVRYYGIKEIDISKMKKTKRNQPTLEELNMERLRLSFEARALVRDIKNNKLIIEIGTPAEIDFATKKQIKLNKKRDDLVKKIKANKEEIDNYEG